ncbi:MAG: hypothetical protein ACREBG_12665, partial [Pyrinomonadaceae bacterium]
MSRLLFHRTPKGLSASIRSLLAPGSVTAFVLTLNRTSAFAGKRSATPLCPRHNPSALAASLCRRTPNKNRSTSGKGWNGHTLTVSPFDGANRIRFKG